MKKVLMWAVGVPLLVVSMVVMSFQHGGGAGAVSVAHPTLPRGR